MIVRHGATHLMQANGVTAWRPVMSAIQIGIAF